MAKKVFITGANKGIGKQVAYQMGKNGWTVLIGARDESRGLVAVDELKSEGIDAIYVNIDLQHPETISSAVSVIQSQHSDLAMLINNAAIPGDMRKPGYEFTLDELREVMETNVFGTFNLTQQLLPVLEKNNGRILNVSIPIGMSDFFNPFAYKMSKAALNTITQSLAQNFSQAAKPIEIFAIMPGGTTTDLNGNMTGDFMKTAPEAGKLIADIIFDGQNHNSEIINFNGKVADYNNGLF
ncbi:SDR family NAD(P)-dependent oxidoreductase [Listeria booriae]|uniref:SDR family NAD(P)-dependent oxidoreductase n=1 Tax=Listeria booriae TaxID=1552123 RepID=UPI0016287155|nr:SDR family NAD(P)-dependent oxidoreductase [Listeria booriae]MBC2056011.1 SDR family NAD(P)-dependent oxidoreductase [Listeria booriae]MBC2100265.1 SDR family NAD(P)-dependent oxidoreductase [Listeria booriae]